MARHTNCCTRTATICQHWRSGCRWADDRYDGQHGSGQEICGGWRLSSSLSIDRCRWAPSRSSGILESTRGARAEPAQLRFGTSAVSPGCGPRPSDPSSRCAGSEENACRKIGSAFNSGDDVSVPFIAPDASFPTPPQSDFERRFGSWARSSGGVLAGVNQAPRGQPDTPNDEDWSAMWRRRTGLP